MEEQTRQQEQQQEDEEEEEEEEEWMEDREEIDRKMRIRLVDGVKQSFLGCVGSGGAVWDASFVMEDYLVMSTTDSSGLTLKDRLVVELGAGVGYLAAKVGNMGATVIATDHEEEVIQRLKANTAAVDTVRVLKVAWGRDDDQLGDHLGGKTVDVLLISDCLFNSDKYDVSGLLHTHTHTHIYTRTFLIFSRVYSIL